jgi:CBS domain-containing protein
MTAGELMTREFEVVHADARVEEAARKLQKSGSATLPVCKDGQLVGMVTHVDLTAGATLLKRGNETTRIGDVIAPDILFCFESTDVAEAASLMKENRVPLIPVLTRNGRMVGVLALKDIPGERASAKVG